jgi:type VI secretion system protein ImpA
MTVDVDALLTPLAPDPAGENLEYDAAYLELEKSAEGVPERQMGNSVLPAEPPDWRAVHAKALALATRTRDLRIAWLVARGGLGHGLTGLRDGLRLIHGLIERHWPHVHPKLDADDGNDPTFRVNLVARLVSPADMLKPLRETPLVEARVVGKFSLREMEFAEGTVAVPAGVDAPKPAAIEAAYAALRQEGAAETLLATSNVLTELATLAEQVDLALTEKAGRGRAVDLTPFTALTKTMLAAHQRWMERAGVASGAAPAPGGATSGGVPHSGGTGSPTQPRNADGIQSREDVVRAIDRICDWYRKAEPSSPVPMLLRRARGLVHKDFLEILRDLTPDGVKQAELLRGKLDAAAKGGDDDDD